MIGIQYQDRQEEPEQLLLKGIITFSVQSKDHFTAWTAWENIRTCV